MKGFLKVVNPNIPTDIMEYSNFKMEAIKYRQEYANYQKLEDIYAEKYNASMSVSTFRYKEYHHFFVMDGESQIGCLELKDEISGIDGQAVGLITIIYVEVSYRNYSWYKNIINDLKEMYKIRIEAETWFEQPDSIYFRKCGFRNVNARLALT